MRNTQKNLLLKIIEKKIGGKNTKPQKGYKHKYIFLKKIKKYVETP